MKKSFCKMSGAELKAFVRRPFGSKNDSIPKMAQRRSRRAVMNPTYPPYLGEKR